MITYLDVTDGDLKLYDCFDAECASGAARALDTANSVGFYNSVIIRDDGRPYISYYDATTVDLKVYNCANTACDSGQAIFAATSSGAIGLFTSVEIGPSGNANIAFYNESNDDLAILNCGNENCDSGNTGRVLDFQGSTGFYASMGLRSNNNPLIAYQQVGNNILRLYDCDDSQCTTGTPKSLDDLADLPFVSHFYLSLVVRNDDRAVISYWDQDQGALKFYLCADTNCDTGVSRTLISDGNTGLFTSLDLRSDQRPVISYWDATQGQVKLYICANPECS